MSLRFPLVAFVTVYSFCNSAIAQNPYKDFDKRSVVVKTDEDIVEAEVYEGLEDKIKKIDPDKTYYWYDHSLIMSTKGGFTGELLHGNFLVQYRNYQIKEQGLFKYGLKQGIWKNWTEGGIIKSFTTYKKGVLHGAYLYYDAAGTWTERGTYKNGNKQGVVYKNAGDGKYVKVNYRKGKEMIPAMKTEKQASEKKSAASKPQKEVANPQKPAKEEGKKRDAAPKAKKETKSGGK